MSNASPMCRLISSSSGVVDVICRQSDPPRESPPVHAEWFRGSGIRAGFLFFEFVKDLHGSFTGARVALPSTFVVDWPFTTYTFRNGKCEAL
jgi:hypothetical protein